MRNRGHRAGLLLATSAIALAGSAEAGETIAYSYDSLGRLVRVERSGTVNSGVNAAYTYDAADNRTNVTVGGPSVAGGGFEAPEIGAWYAYRPTGSPAVFTGNSGITGNDFTWGFTTAPEGDQVGFVQSYGTAATISLPVTGLVPGSRYAFRFHFAVRPNFGANPVTVALDGISLGTFTPTSTTFTPITSAAVVAAAGSGTLTFTGSASAADLGTGLDGVTVVAVGNH